MAVRAGLLLVCAIVVSSRVAAQSLPEPPREPTEEAMAQARADFIAGMGLAEEERWAEALVLFERSYAASGSPVALFNLGSTLRRLERFAEAQIAFERLVDDPEMDPETRANAQRMLDEVGSQLAQLTVEGVPDGLADIEVDGAPQAPTEVRPVVLTVDPGERTLRIALTGFAPWSWSGSVTAGAPLLLRAEMPADGGTDGGSVLDAWWFWALIGGAVAVGLGIGIGVGVDQAVQLQPRTDLVIGLP